MCDEWMPMIQLGLSWDEFHQLPRNSAYKYEYIDGQTYLSPRPKHYHALLALSPLEAEAGFEPVTLRRVEEADRSGLEAIFAGAFRAIQPFGSLNDETRKEAARQALARTWTGGDGPWIERASFVAVHDQQLAGAILITLLPAGDPRDHESYRWDEPPPADCIESRLGRPHLTWIFVHPWLTGKGVGTALLAAAVNELLQLGFTQLLSTFMLGNDSSMLWHWRTGFQLLAHPGSYRHMRQRWSRLQG